jgi:uncharacterized protein
MTPEERLERVRAAYAAAADGDFSIFAEMLAPNVVWHLPGRSPFAGTTTSRDELFARMLRQAEHAAGGVSLEYNGGLAIDSLVTVIERVRASDGRSQLDLGAVVVFRFDDEHVVEATDVFADQSAYDSFWSP